MNNVDLNTVNLIDTECNYYDDDDFGGPTPSIDLKKSNLKTRDYGGSERALASPSSTLLDGFEGGGYNRIDITCSDSCKDDDYTYIDDDDNNHTQKTGFFADFSDDESLDDKELVDEEMLEEKNRKKKSITSGEVEADYWKKIAKKHETTNKKGSRGHFELFPAGNPERNAELFNHMMGSDKYTADGSSSASSLFAAGDVAGNTGTGDGDAGDAGDAGGEGCCEDLNENSLIINEDIKKALDLFGLDLITQADKVTLKDVYEVVPDIDIKNKEQLYNVLLDYTKDYIIYPLQSTTGEKFNNCEDWCKWYTPEKQKTYPQCFEDIAFCRLMDTRLK